MNALIKFPAVSRGLERIKGQTPANSNSVSALLPPAKTDPEYLEFLPAHLEILETPPSPKASWFLWGLCAMLVSILAWSWFARLDIHAIAQGRVQPSGRSKIVQPFEPGRVRMVAVTNGARVRAGDVLIELDPTDSTADRDAALGQLGSLNAEIARRQVAIDAVLKRQERATVTFPPAIPADIQAREQGVLSAELSQYIASRATLIAQHTERRAQRDRLIASVAARERLTALLSERVGMRETLQARAAGSRAQVIDAAQLLAQEETSLAYERGQVRETEAGAASIERRIEQLTQEFLAQQTQRLNDAQRRRDEVQQTLIKVTARMDRTRLTAPIDGTVQQLAVTTVGQVVSTGQPLLTVVPLEAPLEIEALVQNRDIAFIEPGQEVVVKIDSLPFTRYGTLEGKVVRISPDAVDEREAGVADANAAARANSGAAVVGSTPRIQNLVYPVTIQLKRYSIATDGRDVPLTPGMMVTVEVRTGSRRAIDYMLTPLREISAQAGRER